MGGKFSPQQKTIWIKGFEAMGTFFEDTMKALLEAIAIDSADLKEVKNMPAPATEKESELIDRAIEIRK